MNQNKKWYFTTDTNAKGFTYVHAYQTKWDPVRKTPRRSAKRYVGRLFEDGRVIPSKAFLESFPQYAGCPLYYGADKQLVDEETYRRDFPLPPRASVRARRRACQGRRPQHRPNLGG